MELVLDADVVCAALVADGAVHDLLLTPDTTLAVPEGFGGSLDDRRAELAAATGLPERDLSALLDDLLADVREVPREAFAHALPEARALLGDDADDDVPFLALALHLDAGIWTDGEGFADQDAVEVWRTRELAASRE